MPDAGPVAISRWTVDGLAPAACDPPVPGLLLDRDGTLTVESGHLYGPDQLVAVEGAVDAVAQARAAGLILAVVTNQSAIGRGLLTETRMRDLHAQLARTFPGIAAIYHCPHLPDAGCGCRKPSPAMPRRAIAELGLDPARTLLIGDHLHDAEAGLAAGCGAVLVRTGHGPRHAQAAAAAGVPVVADLEAAVRQHLQHLPRG